MSALPWLVLGAALLLAVAAAFRSHQFRFPRVRRQDRTRLVARNLTWVSEARDKQTVWAEYVEDHPGGARLGGK